MVRSETHRHNRADSAALSVRRLSALSIGPPSIGPSRSPGVVLSMDGAAATRRREVRLMAFEGWPVEAVEFYEAARGRQHQGVLAAAQVGLRAVRQGADGGAPGRAGRRLRSRARLPSLPRRALQQGQDPVQDQLRRPPAGRLHLVLCRWALRRQRPLHARTGPAPTLSCRRRRRGLRLELESIVASPAQGRLRRRRP